MSISRLYGLQNNRKIHHNGDVVNSATSPFLTGKIIFYKRYAALIVWKSKKPRVVWRGRSPSKCNPQQRHARCEEYFCEAGLTCESKNTYLAPLPPGSVEDARGKGEGVPERGTYPPFEGCETAPWTQCLVTLVMFRCCSIWSNSFFVTLLA